MKLLKKSNKTVITFFNSHCCYFWLAFPTY